MALVIVDVHVTVVSLSVDPRWRSGVLPGYAPYLLRQRPDTAGHHRYRRGRRSAAHRDHRRADRLQEEDSGRRPDAETPPAADGQPGEPGGARVQGGYVC